jgi:hypothetical protein
MQKLRVIAVAASVGALTACAGQPSTTATPTTTATPAASPATGKPCTLESDRDLIEWMIYRHPPIPDEGTGLPPSAMKFGSIDMIHCRSALVGWHQNHELSEPDIAMGIRACYEIAWADENPGYDADAVPAPRLKHIIDQVGNDC